ncbi:MAG TPA: PQQ-binding-like beta-propeller repeat protein, partial [Jatrophihabitantaceae bacterium]|nr:PQQ-binding-like beta-propeller repeat protein [Jatrophihabitantaceae bacterium]
PAPTLAWHTPEATAIGTPYYRGTVVTYSAHTVNGRNALTGAVTWSLTRTDRTVCQVIEDQAYTITLFDQKGDCTEVTTLDTQTGQRKWERTLDEDDTRADGKAIQHIQGHPSYAVLPDTVLIYSSTVIYAIDPTGGLDRWLFDHAGCTIHSAILGAQGALISQTCTHENCGQRKFCFDGDQVVLRDGTAGRADTDKNPTNPDQIIWTKPDVKAVPASADTVISVVDPAATHLTVLDATKGATLATLPLRGASTTSGIAALETARAELIWIGGTTYSIESTGTDFFWVADSRGPATVTALPGSLTQPVDLNQAIVLVPTSHGADSLTPGTGVAATHYAVGPLPGGSRVYPLGRGLLVAGSATAAYR